MRRLPCSLITLSLLAAGCGSDTSSSGDSANPAAAPSSSTVTAVAAVYPLAWLGGQIAPDAEIALLNAGGQEAHDLDLDPSQRSAIETADVVLYTGDIEYQPQVEDAVEAAQGEVVAAAEVAGEDSLLTITDAHAHEDEAHADEEGEAHADEGEAHADEGGGAHADEGGEEHADEAGGVDPHLWFDAEIMSELAVTTGEAFATADPDNAETYRGNAEQVVAEMATLREDLDTTLGGQCSFDEAIVSHAAYGYLLEPYGKEQHAVTGVTAESDASAGELAEIVAEIREEGFTHVLAEPVEGREGAETVVREAGVEMLEVLPLDAVSEQQGEQGLPDLVRAQAAAFATALGCA